MCEALLPLDGDRRRDWVVWFAFLARAVADASFANEQRERVRGARAILAKTVCAARPKLSRTEADDESRRILTIVDGIAVQAVFDPDDWPPARQRRLLKAELAR